VAALKPLCTMIGRFSDGKQAAAMINKINGMAQCGSCTFTAEPR